MLSLIGLEGWGCAINEFFVVLGLDVEATQGKKKGKGSGKTGKKKFFYIFIIPEE